MKQREHRRSYSSGKTKTINKGKKQKTAKTQWHLLKSRFDNLVKNNSSNPYDLTGQIDRALSSQSNDLKIQTIESFDENNDLGKESYDNPNQTLKGLKRSSEEIGGVLSSNPRVKNKFGDDIGSLNQFTKKEQRILKNREKKGELTIENEGVIEDPDSGTWMYTGD